MKDSVWSAGCGGNLEGFWFRDILVCFLDISSQGFSFMKDGERETLALFSVLIIECLLSVRLGESWIRKRWWQHFHNPQARSKTCLWLMLFSDPLHIYNSFAGSLSLSKKRQFFQLLFYSFRRECIADLRPHRGCYWVPHFQKALDPSVS